MGKMMAKSARNIELGKIHLGAKQLGLEDNAYRDMLWTIARVRSSADLDEQGRQDVIEHLQLCGAVFTRTRRTRPAQGRKKLVSKVRAFLTEAERPDAYADGMAQKMFGVDKFEWLDRDQLRRLVAALIYDARRHDRRT